MPHWIAYQEVIYPSPWSTLSGESDYSDIKLPANTPNVFGHPSHVWYYHQWSLLLLLFLVWAAYVCCFLCGWDRSIADEVHRVLSLLEDTSKAVKVFFLHQSPSKRKDYSDIEVPANHPDQCYKHQHGDCLEHWVNCLALTTLGCFKSDCVWAIIHHIRVHMI